jgi:hypothetical protein
VTEAIESLALSATSGDPAKNGMSALFQAPEFADTLIRVGLPLVRYRLRISRRQGGCRHLAQTLAECDGTTLGEKWLTFERRIWPGWAVRLRREKAFARRVAFAPWTAVLSSLVRPSYDWIFGRYVLRHLARLPTTHRWRVSAKRFEEAMRSLAWVRCAQAQHCALTNAVRILIHHGYDRLEQIQIEDVRELYALVGTKGPTGWPQCYRGDAMQLRSIPARVSTDVVAE